MSLNFERIRYWIGNGADVSESTAQLLGLAGFYPIHPRSFIQAWRNRERLEREQEVNEAQKIEKESSSVS